MANNDTGNADYERRCQAATCKGFRCKNEATSYQVYEGDGLMYLSCKVHFRTFQPHPKQIGTKPTEEEIQSASDCSQYKPKKGAQHVDKETGHIQVITDQSEIDILEENVEMQKNLKEIDTIEATKINRETAIKEAEKYLGGNEYNLERITSELSISLNQIANGLLFVGQRLLAVKIVEGHGNFTKWLEQNFQLSPRQARRFMSIADKVKNRPELSSFAKHGTSKALVLLDMPEEYQDEYVQDGTIDGKPLDEYHTMTREELKAEIKKLKNNQNKIIDEETKALRSEPKSRLKRTLFAVYS